MLIRFFLILICNSVQCCTTHLSKVKIMWRPFPSQPSLQRNILYWQCHKNILKAETFWKYSFWHQHKYYDAKIHYTVDFLKKGTVWGAVTKLWSLPTQIILWFNKKPLKKLNKEKKTQQNIPRHSITYSLHKPIWLLWFKNLSKMNSNWNCLCSRTLKFVRTPRNAACCIMCNLKAIW